MRSFLMVGLSLFCVFEVLSQTCVDSLNLIAPAASRNIWTNYAASFDIDDDVMVVGEARNDSLASGAGVVYVYKEGADGTWRRQALLAPSSPSTELGFGRKAQVSGNVIAVAGQRYSNSGFEQQEVFVFTKQIDQEWTTKTENLIIEPGEALSFTDRRIIMDVDINDRFLAISYVVLKSGGDVEEAIQLFDVQNNFELLQTLNTPDTEWANSQVYNLELGHDFLAFYGGNLVVDKSQSLVIYQYDEMTGWSSNPTASLSTSHDGRKSLGRNLLVKGTSVITTSESDGNADPNTDLVHLYLQPTNGWFDMKESDTLRFENQIPNSFPLIAANDTYLVVGNHAASIFSLYEFDDQWVRREPIRQFETSDPNRRFVSIIKLNRNQIMAKTASIYSNRINTYVGQGGDLANASFSQDLFEISYSTSGDNFSQAIDVSDLVMVIGARSDDDQGFVSGAVHLYRKRTATWHFEQKVYAPVANVGDNFGSAVAISGDLLFVSSPLYDSLDEAGTVLFRIGKVFQYEYKNGVWEFRQEILSPELFEADPNQIVNAKAGFGQAITFNNGVLAISQYNSGSSRSKGQVHLYQQGDEGEWDYLKTLSQQDWNYGDDFGLEMVMTDSIMAVTGKDANGNPVVYVFTKKESGWSDTFEDGILRPSGNFSNRFGASISVHRDFVLVGDPGAGNHGKAFLFQRPSGGWNGSVNERYIFEPANPIERGDFGQSVYLDDQKILVGASALQDLINPSSYNRPKEEYAAGRVYEFPVNLFGREKVINESRTIFPPEGHGLDGFGFRIVGNSSEELFISSPYKDLETGDQSGSMYIYKSKVQINPPLEPVCIGGGPVQLSAIPANGGVWSGPGIVDEARGVFDPGGLAPGDFEIMYTYGGCTAVQEIQVVAVSTPIDQSPVVTVKCPGEEVDLFAIYDRPGLFEWSHKQPGDADFTVLKRGESSGFTASKTGTYALQLLDQLCQPEPVFFEIQNQSVEASLNYEDDLVLCSGEVFNLEVQTPVSTGTISWYFRSKENSTFQIFSNENRLTGISDAGFYIGSFSYKGCNVFTDTIEVIIPVIEPTIQPLPVICDRSTPVPIEVFPPGGDLWFAGELLTDRVLDPMVMQSGAYLVRYELDSLGCSFVTEEQVLLQIQDVGDIVIPNVFTPNGDQINDSFEIDAPFEGFDQFRIDIYDRQGKITYSSKNPLFSWDGASSRPGIYYWFLEYDDLCGNERKLRGQVQVLR